MLKNDSNAYFDEKSIKIVVWKYLGGGATVIPGTTFIPESRDSRQTKTQRIGRGLEVGRH